MYRNQSNNNSMLNRRYNDSDYSNFKPIKLLKESKDDYKPIRIKSSIKHKALDLTVEDLDSINESTEESFVESKVESKVEFKVESKDQQKITELMKELSNLRVKYENLQEKYNNCELSLRTINSLQHDNTQLMIRLSNLENMFNNKFNHIEVIKEVTKEATKEVVEVTKEVMEVAKEIVPNKYNIPLPNTQFKLPQ